MTTFDIPTSAEAEDRAETDIRDFLTLWVGLLADRKYAEALDLLSPEIPRGSGSVDSRKIPHWTPSLLEAVIANYGTPEPVLNPPMPQSYAVAPLDSELRGAFEANVSIDFDRSAISGLDRSPISPEAKRPQGNKKIGWLSTKLAQLGRSRSAAKSGKTPWLGGADFQLPLNFQRGNDLSDLSARMRFKPVTKTEMVLVLLDIHVL
jgi:hypothetical protein